MQLKWVFVLFFVALLGTNSVLFLKWRSAFTELEEKLESKQSALTTTTQELRRLEMETSQCQTADNASVRQARYGRQHRKVVGSFASDWKRISDLLKNPNNFLAMARYGDGERLLIEGQAVGSGTQAWSVDRWKWSGGQSLIGKDLMWSLRGHRNQNFFYGFACPKSDAKGLENYLKNTEQGLDFVTFANLWINSNYPKTKKWFQEVIENERGKIVVICNEEVLTSKKTDLSWASDVVTYPDNGPSWWEKNREQALRRAEDVARKYEGRLFMVSVGPLAKVLVARMWEVNPRNRYVDFGSAIDELVKGRSTRPYTNPNSYYGKWVDASWQLDSHGVPEIVPDP